MRSILTLIFLLAYHAFAQNFTNTAQYHFGSSGIDANDQTIRCTDGGFLILTSSNGGNMDKTDPSFGGLDLWILRLNADRSIRWQRTLGGDQDEDGKAVMELPNGDFIVLSDSKSGVSGNKQSPNYGNKDFWVLRLDADGNVIWDKTFGSDNIDASSDLLATSDSTFVIVGGSNGGQSGTKIQSSFGGLDYWVVAFDAAGNELWQAVYGGAADDYTQEMKSIYLNNNNVLVVGRSESLPTGNKTATSFGMADTWILEVDRNSGSIIRQESFGGDKNDVLYGVTQIGNSLFLAGYSNSDVSGNKQSPLYGTGCAWLLEIDSVFQILSDQSFGGSSFSNFQGITKIPVGFVVTGICADDSNPWVSRPVNGTYDGWLMGFDSAGNYLWNYSFGAVNVVNEAVADYIDLGMNQFMFAYTSWFTTASGDVTQPNYGAFDFYLIECSSDLNTGEVFATEHLIFPNPVKDQLFISDLAADATLEIWDTQGKVVFSGVYEPGINLSHLSPGLFTVSVRSANSVSQLKFVKVP